MQPAPPARSAVVASLTLAVEWVGHTTGFPFGEYDYTGALAPTLAGVPVIVPLAWFAMGVTALEVGHHIARSRVGAVAIGALALTAWDLFLDPQMVDAGYWQWADDGAYHGIPWSNYAGWLGTGAVVLGIVEWLRPPVPSPSLRLLALYTLVGGDVHVRHSSCSSATGRRRRRWHRHGLRLRAGLGPLGHRARAEG